MYSYIAAEAKYGLKRIDVETIHECTARARGTQVAQYKYIDTRYIYRVEDEQKFLLLLLEIGLSFKESNPNSYSLSDEY